MQIINKKLLKKKKVVVNVDLYRFSDTDALEFL